VSSLSRRAIWAYVPVAVLLAALLSGCNGPTIIDQATQIGNYKIDFSIEPQTLKPPQFATLNYGVLDASTNKPPKAFDPVYGALMHNVIVSRDLTVFRHSYTDRGAQDQFSMPTEFPQTGEYYSYTIFKPAGADVQVLKGTIQSGDAGNGPVLAVDTDRAKLAYGSRFELLTAKDGVHVGKPSQLAIYATERGNPVTELWPFLNAPGYLWVIGQDGNNFGVEVGAAQGRPMGGDNSTGQVVPAPTLIPDLQEAIASRTVQPVPSLVPAQQTALVSVVQTPGLVVPTSGYGPTIIFTHTFPKAGLYKMWAEMQYRNQVFTVDWVVNVAP
jgi:hypothetical protein